MNRELIDSLLKSAQVHTKRIRYALRELKGKTPLTKDGVIAFKDRDLLLWELLTSRFGKLQDLLGNKLFSTFLYEVGENIDTWTMVDKLNKLERLGVIPDRDTWLKMRQLGNHLAHEYPDMPELIADYLNQTVAMAPILLKITNLLQQQLEKRKSDAE